MSKNPGDADLIEAVRFLKAQKPINSVQLSDGMSKACRDLVLDQGPSAGKEHTSSDGSSIGARLKRYGRPTGPGAEGLAFGTMTGEEAIASLMIDPTYEVKLHRKALFNPKFGAVGVYTGPWGGGGATEFCIDYATGFQDKNGQFYGSKKTRRL